MEIIKAEHLGFCNGVKRAINVAKAHAPCLTYKELIHNKKVVDGLKNEGIYPVHDLSVVQSGDNVVIAAHSAAPSDFENSKRRLPFALDRSLITTTASQLFARDFASSRFAFVV